MTNLMKIIEADINGIKKYNSNARIHLEKQIQQIATSIKKFGFNNPILIDEKSEIIAGHGRYEAAILLNLKTVPVIQIEHLNELEKKAYRIADNKLTENGQWDTDLLKIEFSEIEKLSLEINNDFCLDITGFDCPEIDFLLDAEKKDTKNNQKLNAVPYVPENEIISKPGDIWVLGKHKIICGNSLEQKTFETLLGDQKADLIFTDPPYNVKVSSIGSSGKIKHKEFAMASGEMSEKEFTGFLKTVFENMAAFSKEGSVHYICMDWKHVHELTSAALNVYHKILNLAVWCKTNGGMGSFYRSQHELIFIYQIASGPHTNNVELGKHGRYRTNVWQYAGVNSFGKNQKHLKMHPTVKPVELIKDAILDASVRGQIVFDAFLGSGSTLIAAEKTGRICFGIEYEPLYIDTIIRRYHELFGLWAYREEDKMTYDSLLLNLKEANHD